MRTRTMIVTVNDQETHLVELKALLIHLPQVGRAMMRRSPGSFQMMKTFRM